jgi:hypothetical protein
MMNTTQTKMAEWPKDFAVLDMPWGPETINTTWPLIAVCVPQGDKGTKDYDPAMMYHTDTRDIAVYADFWLVKQPDGTYLVS